MAVDWIIYRTCLGMDCYRGNVGSVGGAGRYDKLIGSFLVRMCQLLVVHLELNVIEVMKDRKMLDSEI
jgi:hypothetical protein